MTVPAVWESPGIPSAGIVRFTLLNTSWPCAIVARAAFLVVSLGRFDQASKIEIRPHSSCRDSPENWCTARWDPRLEFASYLRRPEPRQRREGLHRRLEGNNFPRHPFPPRYQT